MVGLCQDTVGMHLPFKDGKLTYEGIVNVAGKNKMDLYADAKKWFTDYFIDSRDVIQMQDKDQGRIIGKGILVFSYKVLLSSVKFYDLITVEIDVKDGRYRYRVYDMVLANLKGELFSDYGSRTKVTPEQLISTLTGTGKSGYTKTECQKLLRLIDGEAKSTIHSLTTTVSDNSNTF